MNDANEATPKQAGPNWQRSNLQYSLAGLLLCATLIGVVLSAPGGAHLLAMLVGVCGPAWLVLPALILLQLPLFWLLHRRVRSQQARTPGETDQADTINTETARQ